MNKSKVFIGGMPYGPDIKKLDESWPVSKLAEGLIIQHEELEALLGIRRGSQRYYGVVNAWTAKHFKHNDLHIEWQHAVGIKVLNPADRLGFWDTRVLQKNKQYRRALAGYTTVPGDRLDEVGKKHLDHQRVIAAKSMADALHDRRALSIELAPVKSLPKPVLIDKAS